MANVRLGDISVSEPDVFRTLTESEIIITFELDEAEPGKQTLDIKVHFTEDSESAEGKVLTKILVQNQKVTISNAVPTVNTEEILRIIEQEIQDLFPEEYSSTVWRLAQSILTELECRFEEEGIFFCI
jgi:hypothetical protein